MDNFRREILCRQVETRYSLGLSWEAKQAVWRASIKIWEGKLEEALDLLLEALASR
jgi:hypothetical protein